MRRFPAFCDQARETNDGFHIPRTKLIAAQVNFLEGEDLYWIAAYGPQTKPENWFEDQTGRDIILNEFRKTVILSQRAGIQLFGNDDIDN